MTDETVSGDQVSHYKILEKLGEGGMGVVYKAQDLRLDRLVALKFLPPQFGREEDRKKRFIQEAKAASALDHPNICTIHEIDETGDGHLFIAMAYYQGETVKDKIERGPLAVGEATGLALQIAQGLAKAHSQGLVHRDIKPANVMVTGEGVAKIVDFGLAKMAGAADLTKTGTTMGTAAYMSPEQAQGEHVDQRTDVWSLGVVLYEMVTGQRPFRADHAPGLIYAVVHEKPLPITSVRSGLPLELERIVVRALEKDPTARYPSAAEMAKDLADYQSSLTTAPTSSVDLKLLFQQSKRPRVAVPMVLVFLALVATGTWVVKRGARARWARDQALPEIDRLVEAEKYPAAFAVAREAEKYLPANDLTLAGFWPRMSRTVSVETIPPGADVYFREYSAADSPWENAGRSPIELRVPRGLLRWKFAKQGFQTIERAIGGINRDASTPIALTLDAEGGAPAGMVRVSGGAAPYALVMPGFEHIQPVSVEDYWIDKYEVTNKQYKEFVDRGGYQKQEYWKEKFVKDGRTLTWQEAVAQFRDAAGRPGPATWELGDYPRGQDDYPVSGVSWYEAAAYAQFAGKSLPTIFHWNKAAAPATATAIVPLSNFAGQGGPARIGLYRGMNPSGTYDMAGNVKEWCWNGTGDGKRYILGGAWNEPVYMFFDADAQSPFDRSANFGFRCVKYVAPDAVSKAATDNVASITSREFEKEKPVSDEVFRAYRSLYSYDKAPLNAAAELVDDANPDWRKEKVSFAAAYGNERVTAYLFLPKRSSPPFQTVAFFPGSNVIALRSSKELQFYGDRLDFLIRSGRAVIFPIYKGTFERGDDLKSDVPNMTGFYRDHMIMWSKDLARSIDYLETRPEIDRGKIGYYGFSWGSQVSPAMIAMESRLKVAVLGAGGFCFQRPLPEVDMINFVSRVKIPVLMLNGRYDFFFPIETSQKPLLRLLGTPKEHKRHILYESGHSIPRTELIKETLDWLDRYLGPVK